VGIENGELTSGRLNPGSSIVAPQFGAISMSKFSTAIRKFIADETGATMVEYALILALIAVACITAVTALGSALTTEFGTITSAI
jgi:pilus assembly protein Flp/PilA